MTLPPNLPSAKPAATTSDSFAGLGAPTKSSAATASSTTFSSVLTKADAASPASGVPSGKAKPSARTRTVYSKSCDNPDAGADSAAPATLAAGSNDDPLPDAVGADGKPVSPSPTSTKDKQKDGAPSAATSGDASEQGAKLLAFQLIAGQWVPQPVPQQPAVETSATPSAAEADLAATVSAATSEDPLFANGETAQALNAFPQTPAAALGMQNENLSRTEKQALGTKGTVSGSAAAVFTATTGSPLSENVPLAQTPDVAQPERQGASSNAASTNTMSTGSQLSGNSPLAQTPDVAQPEGQGTSSNAASADTTTLADSGNSGGSAIVSSVKPETAFPAVAKKELSDGAVQPSSSVDADAAEATDPSTKDAATQFPARRLPQGRSQQTQAPEKIADPDASGRINSASRVISSNSAKEKKSLLVDDKELKSTSKSVGTGVANQEFAMPYSAVTKPSNIGSSTIVGDGLQLSNAPAVVPADVPAAAHAPRLVQEIREIADRISVIDRNSIEVRFDFSDTDRLSVRVEYRDGTVHTTFNTDSAQLRNAIAQEWQKQTVAADERPYRVAEPVFSQTTSDRQNSFSSGEGSGRQRSFEQTAQPGTPSYASSGRMAHSAAPTSATAVRYFRPETSVHLHVLA